MSTLETDFWGIAAGLLLSSVGVISIVISLFRLSSKDLSLFNFGLFCSLNGIRWLVEIPTMKALVGFPFTVPYFHGLLTYALVIPFSAFLLNIFGRGLYDSMLWVFRSTILYATAAIAYDLYRPGALPDVSVTPAVIVLWCVVWIVNILFTRRPRSIELRVLRIVFLATLAYTAIDNLFNLRILPWGAHLEHTGFLVLCVGLGYVAVRHFFSNERRLLAIEQEVEIARRIQHSNLPGDLRFPNGLDIAARYVPMSTVAGDFYDIQIAEGCGVGSTTKDRVQSGGPQAGMPSGTDVCAGNIRRQRYTRKVFQEGGTASPIPGWRSPLSLVHLMRRMNAYLHDWEGIRKPNGTQRWPGDQ